MKFGILLLLLASCSHHSINNVNYERHNAYTAGKVITQSYKEIGPVIIEESDYIFTSCNEIAEKALTKLAEQAKQQGGNTLHNVMWMTSNTDGTNERFTPIPTCQIGWGWFSAFGVGGLSPWVKSVKVTASISKVGETQTAQNKSE